jgi:hypothetical protein
MKISCLLLPALLAISGSALCQPKVLLPEGKFLDLGDALNFFPKKRSMVIKNTGNDTLIISNVGASCGCTALLLSENHIPPNDSASLLITLNPSQFNGNVEKLISFNTNDKTQPLVEVKFKANVIRILEVDPQYLFLRGSVGAAIRQDMTIINLSDKSIKIISANSSLKDLSVSLSDKVLKPHEKITASVTFTPLIKGSQSGNIAFETDHPLLSTFSIRIHSYTK